MYKARDILRSTRRGEIVTEESGRRCAVSIKTDFKELDIEWDLSGL
jgi:hypothetical protein